MSSTTLDLLREAGALVASLEAPEGADAGAFDAGLAGWVEASGDKLAALHAVTRRLSAEDAEMKAIVDRVSARRRHLARQSEHIAAMATSLLLAREALGEEPRVKRPEWSAWLAESVSVSVSVPPESLPAEWQRRKVVVEADKAAIRAAIEAGETVTGCELVTTRGVRWRS